MPAAISLSLKISETRLMNQWNRLNSLIKLVKSSGASNKISNIVLKVDKAVTGKWHNIINDINDITFEFANSKVMFTWRLHWFLSEIKERYCFNNRYIFTDIISDYFTDLGIESKFKKKNLNVCEEDKTKREARGSNWTEPEVRQSNCAP